jgi:hypothetical protein
MTIERTGPVDAEQFRRTAPAWNCVDYPGDGPHYTPGAVACAWCGATPGQIRAEHELRESTAPRDNTRKIAGVLGNRCGRATLYRTAVAGPSGQTRALHVGTAAYTYQGRYEVELGTPGGLRAGWAARTADSRGEWAVWADGGDDRLGDEPGGEIALAGWASSLAIAADVVVNGAHAATGRHDSRRTSGGTWVPYVYQEQS